MARAENRMQFRTADRNAGLVVAGVQGLDPLNHLHKQLAGLPVDQIPARALLSDLQDAR